MNICYNDWVVKLGFRERGTTGKSAQMAEKKLTDLKEFIQNVNKKNTNHSGKKIRFAFVKKKRKA
jgi:hypothetical protein